MTKGEHFTYFISGISRGASISDAPYWPHNLKLEGPHTRRKLLNSFIFGKNTASLQILNKSFEQSIVTYVYFFL